MEPKKTVTGIFPILALMWLFWTESVIETTIKLDKNGVITFSSYSLTVGILIKTPFEVSVVKDLSPVPTEIASTISYSKLK